MATSEREMLEQDEMIATDAGTHGGPIVVEAYQRLNGSMYSVRRQGGAVVGRSELASLGELQSESGRIRYVDHDVVARRRRHAELVRAEQACRAQPARGRVAARDVLLAGLDAGPRGEVAAMLDDRARRKDALTRLESLIGRSALQQRVDHIIATYGQEALP